MLILFLVMAQRLVCVETQPLIDAIKPYDVEIVPKEYAEWTITVDEKYVRNESELIKGSVWAGIFSAGLGFLLSSAYFYGIYGSEHVEFDPTGAVIFTAETGIGGALLWYLLNRNAERYQKPFFKVTLKQNFGKKKVIVKNYSFELPGKENYEIIAKDIVKVLKESQPAIPFIAYVKDKEDVYNLAGEVMTRLPAGTEIKVIAEKWDKYYIQTPGGVEGWLSKDKIILVKPDVMKPFIKITEKKLKGPFLYLRGVVYDDKFIKKVEFAGEPLARADFLVDKGNYGDAYPFEIKYTVGPGEKLTLRAVDGIGKTTELPIGIETRKVDYVPKYAVLRTKSSANVYSEPTTKSTVLMRIAENEQIVSIGYKGDWFYLEGGGWIQSTLVEEIETELAGTGAIVLKPEEKIEKFVDVDINIPRTSMRNEDAIAIVIGNRDYEKVSPVEYALRDAKIMKKYLVNVLGYKEGNVILVENAKLSDFMTYFGTKDNYKGKLYDYVKPDKSDIFVYYSGHGAPGLRTQKGYFVPVDCDPQKVEMCGYSLDLFYENIDKIPARNKIIVIDACFSGADILKGISPIYIKVLRTYPMENTVIFTSTSGTEASCWYDEKRHSMFTYFFLKGLRGEADLNNDGNITYKELYEYISDKTEGVPYWSRRLYGFTQIPQMQPETAEGILVILK